MKFLIGLVHPIVMLAFFYLLYAQRQIGTRIAALKERSPDYDSRPGLLVKHLQQARLLLILGFAGLIGGVIITTYVLGAPQPLVHTYGHGFFGLIILSVLVAAYFLGSSVKHVVKPKIQERFFGFHANMIYLMAVFGLCSLATGLWVLVKGPGMLE